MAQVVWFKQSKGLATKYDPARIEYNPKTGVSHFSEAYNIDFDFTGAVFRRKGIEATSQTGVCHSFFWAGGECVFVQDNGLYLLAEDTTVTKIRSDLAPTRMSFSQVGDAITYMNGYQSGVIRNGANYTYVKSPETYYPDPTREYNDPPIGEIIRFFAGRTWIAVGNNLLYSEPFAPNLFRLAANYIPFPARITMIAPVRAGLFVSTTSKIYFMAGTNPREMAQITVAHYSAIKGTDVEVDGISLVGGKISPLPMQMFTTTNGICAGTAEGQLVNLTYETLEYPKALQGSAVYTGDKYIVSLGSDSTKLTLCMSLGIAASSQYAGFDFQGMCKFHDKIIGGNSNGLFVLLSGDTDDGDDIDAHFRTGPTSFGFENEKRLRRLYLGMRSDGVMKMSISGDDKPDIVREVTPHDNTLRVIHQQVNGGRDIRGKNLDLKVANVGGSDFTITEIQAVLVVQGTKTTEVM